MRLPIDVLRYALLAVGLIFMNTAAGQAAPPWKLNTTTLAPASVEQARMLLVERDDFTERLSRFDRAARLRTDQPVSDEQFFRHLAQNTLPWNDEELAKLEQAIMSIDRRLAVWQLPLPEKIWLVKMTGEVDGGAAYTRGSAIMLPEQRVQMPVAQLERLLVHELFHVLSRLNPELREKLYAIVGFYPCNEVELPASLRDRKITNPDAPRTDYYTELTIDDAPVYVVPVLIAPVPQYDPQRGGTLMDYLGFHLLVVERRDNRWVPALREGEPILLDGFRTPALYDRIGRNTGYIIHPEEVLAENFVLLVMDERTVPTPRVLEQLEAALKAPMR